MYVLEEPLGSGASGEVWRGRSHTGEEYAFKILHNSLSGDPETVRRFLQEGKILTSVDHPNVVRVHGLVAEGETLAIVMDLVKGRDLRKRLAEWRVLPPAQACGLAAEAAVGLGAIHEAGIVHRDIKPENILLDDRATPQRVKLTDFGIARIAERTGASTTGIVGTPQYIAPELADGQAATSASDLYSLGIMLYELCCGVTPFASDSTITTIKRHGLDAPGRPEGIPDQLWELISTLLEKDPQRRPPSAGRVAIMLGALAQELRPLPAAPVLTVPPPSVPLLHSEPTELRGLPNSADPTQPPVPPKRRRRLVTLAAGGALLLAIVGVAGYATLRQAGGGPSRPVPQQSTQQPVAGALPSGDGTSQAPSSPAAISYGPNQLPDLKGKALAEARALLPPTVTVQVVLQEAPAGTPDGVVLAQDPQPGAALTPTVQLTVSSQQATQYLADLTPTAGEFSSTNSADLELSGHPQLHAVGSGGNACSGETGTVEYDLGQHYAKLVGLVGIDDHSKDAKAQATLEVYGDQRKLKSYTVHLGKPQQLDVNVTGVLHLSLRWTFTGLDAAYCSGATIVIGDGQLVAASGYVPPATATPTE
jgi:serine/threonine protein kinase